MPDIHITVDGRPALTTAQAAVRRGITRAAMRTLLSRIQLDPAAELDDRTPLYDQEILDMRLAALPGKGHKVTDVRRPGPTTAQRRARRALERDPDRAHRAIQAIVMGYDEDLSRQRLEGADHVEAMTAAIRDAWLEDPAGQPGGLRGFTERWLVREYGRWCDARGMRK